LLLRLEGLLGLEGLLLRNKSRSRLSESWCSGLLRNLRLSKELSMRRVSRVNEGVKTSTVSAVWNSIAIMRCLRLCSLRLCPLRLCSLRLCSLWLSSRAARKLSCVGVDLEIQVSGVSWVDKRVDFSLLLSRSGRSKLLSLNRSLLKLLLSNRGLLLPNGSLANWSWASTRGFTHWSRLLRLNKLSSSRIWIKCSRVQSIGSFRNMITFKDSESILAGCVSDSNCLSIIINITILSNSFTICSSFFSED